MVKNGYKQTDIGVIPEDWEVNLIGNIFEFKNGLNKAKEFFGYGTPIVNYMDVFKHYGLKANEIIGKVDVTREELNAYNVKKGDVFFTRTSETVDEIGITTVILEDVKDTVFSGFILRARPINNDLDVNYKKYCFSLKNIRTQIISTASYTTRALTNGKSLSKVKIPIPPKEEQQAISNALSDTDELITSLEKLISKKEAVKQGTMQQLLTGKKRLNGFSNKWEDKKLENIATSITMGQSPSSSNYNINGIGLPLVQGNADIKNRKTIIRNYTSQITKKAFSGDIIMSVRAPVGEVAKTYFDCCIGRGVCSIKTDNEYLYYYLIFMESKWTKSSTGSTFDSVNSDEIRSLNIFLPSEKNEQKAIAQILLDMDSEIETLKSKLSKTKAIKDGMMSELLIGKTRLKY